MINILEIQKDCFSQICTQLPVPEILKLGQVNRQLRVLVRQVLVEDCCNPIMSEKAYSHLNRLALRHPLEDSDSGKIERVKRLVSDGFHYVRISRVILSPKEWEEFGMQIATPSLFRQLAVPILGQFKPQPKPISTTLRQLDSCLERIQTTEMNLNLDRLFTKIVEQIPEESQPVLEGNCDQRAATIRKFMTKNPELLDNILSLDLEGLKLTALPPEILQLHNLVDLSLKKNLITHLPDGFNPPALTDLDLSDTQLTHLPDDFNPPTLTFLDLSRTQLTHLPDGFNPPALTQLYLTGTPITHLPDGFNPPALTMLGLTYTQLTHLSDGFKPPALSKLGLTNTQITHLPDDFNPPALTMLGLSNTQITHLPDGFNPPALTMLDLSDTPITHLPDGFNPPALRELYLSNTQITHFPGAFTQHLPHAYLSCVGNRVRIMANRAWNYMEQYSG